MLFSIHRVQTNAQHSQVIVVHTRILL